jgi:sialic acid synthase
MMRDIRLLEFSFGKKEIFIDESVKQTKIKLERSIATNRIIKKGEIIKLQDIHLLSPGDGFKWSERQLVLGKKTLKDIPQDEVIYINDIE